MGWFQLLIPLLAGPCCAENFRKILKHFGVVVHPKNFAILGDPEYRPTDYTICGEPRGRGVEAYTNW